MAFKSRITVYLLVFSLVMPPILTYGWLQWQKRTVRKKIKHELFSKLEKRDLVTIMVTSSNENELRWEHSKEFEYQEIMYDIVSEYQSKDTVYYVCWPDAEETILNIQLKNLTSNSLQKNTTRQQANNRLIHFYLSLFINNVDFSDAIIKKISKKKDFENGLIYASIKIKPLIPPPKTLFV